MISSEPGSANGSPSSSEVQAQIHYRLVERLSASERHYRALVEGLRDPVFQCDPTGLLTYRNPAWASMFGEDASSGRTHLGDYVHPEDVGILRRMLDDAAHVDGGCPVVGEVRTLTCEGASLHVEISLRTAPEGDLMGSLHNMTQERERQASLREAKRAAEEANRMKSSFLANMSHEIRTPLSAVLGFADLLSQAGLSDSDREDYRMRVVRNGRQLLALVDDILDFSKVESGRLEVAQEAFEPCTLIDDLAASFTPHARARDIELAVRWSGDAPPEPLMVSDPVRLRQILSNLISNALKFTSEGAVSLDVVADARAGLLRFVVEDSGMGITADKLETIFEPFRQVDSALTREYGGSGLGLAISQRLAGLLGGEIRAESEPGRGSRFTLVLPLRTAPASSAPESRSVDSAERRAPAPAARALLVEDTRDLATLMTRFIRGFGYEVDVARNGAEALEAVERAEQEGRGFGAILMDMQMPVMDGYQATRALRASGYDGAVIALTAHAMRGDRERCLAAGCDEYLSKPVKKTQLRDVLERFCTESPS